MLTTYHKINDPGHGWLAVPVSELVELKLVDSISRYSYLKGTIAYLEEDCDAMKFIHARWPACASNGYAEVNAAIKDRYVERTTIRHFPDYTPDAARVAIA